MKPRPSRWLTDYGMILALLLLCAFFSVVTTTEQSPTGDAAAAQLAPAIVRRIGAAGRVLIVGRDQAEDHAFALRLERELAAAGVTVLGVVKGEPKDARDALVKLTSTNGKLEAIACTRVTAAWLVFAALKTDFPALGDPQILVPRSYRWPDFLKADNLLNIANQIAVIAIVAIGMTLVIIAGGIDLSVGSLLALSAVLSARFIRDWAGGTQAGTVGMILACGVAILMCGFVGAFTGAMITRFGIPPFIATLAMMLVGSGLAYILAGGQTKESGI